MEVLEEIACGKFSSKVMVDLEILIEVVHARVSNLVR